MTEDEALFGISDEESQPALFSTENFKPKEERQSTVQPTLNELGAGYEYEPWKREWHDMPECENHEMKPYDSVVVRFANKEAQDAFSTLIGQALTKGKEAKSIWFPKLAADAHVCIDSSKRWTDES